MTKTPKVVVEMDHGVCYHSLLHFLYYQFQPPTFQQQNQPGAFEQTQLQNVQQNGPQPFQQSNLFPRQPTSPVPQFRPQSLSLPPSPSPQFDLSQFNRQPQEHVFRVSGLGTVQQLQQHQQLQQQNQQLQQRPNGVPACANCDGVNPFVNPFDSSHQQQPQQFQPQRQTLQRQQQQFQHLSPAPQFQQQQLQFDGTPVQINRFQNGFNFEFSS